MRRALSLLAAIAASLLATPARAGQDHWTPIGPAGQNVRALLVSGGETFSAFVGTAGGEVLVTTDGINWAPKDTGLPGASITTLAFSPMPSPPCPGPCLFPAALLAGTEGAGIFQTVDGGAHWTPANSGLTNLSVQSLASASGTNTAYAGTLAGLFKTTNSAATWAPVAAVPSPVSAVVVDPLHPSTVYAGTSSTESGNGAVYRSTDGGISWSSTPAFASGNSILALAIDPQTTSTLYASVLNSGFFCPTPCSLPPTGATYYVYKSVDSGSTWFEADAGLALAGRVVSLAVDPAAPTTLYAGGTGGVFRSVDGGATWSGYNAGLSDTNVQVLALDPASPANVYAGTASSGVFANTFSASGGCSIQTLCLVNGRFQVQVNWKSSGEIRAGQAAPATVSAGNFWFLTPDNLELTIKVLDGRSVNGSWWVFVGALSNVEYTVTVTDTVTLVTRTYFNPQGRLASVADTSAF